MSHTNLGLFDDVQSAQRALDDLSDQPESAEIESINIHRGDVSTSDIEPAESSFRHGLATGAAIGGIGGAVIGVAAAPILGVSYILAAIIGAVTTALFGMLGGALVGQTEPAPALRELDENAEGDVVVSVKADTEAADRAVKRVFRRHGARETRQVSQLLPAAI